MISKGSEEMVELVLEALDKRRGIRQSAEAYVFIFPGAEISKQKFMERAKRHFQLGIRPKICVFQLEELSYSAIFSQGIDAFKGRICEVLGDFEGEEGIVLLSSLAYSLATESVKVCGRRYHGISFEGVLKRISSSGLEVCEEISRIMYLVRDLYAAIASLDPRKVGLRKEELRREIRKARRLEKKGEEILGGILLGIENDLWEIFSCGPGPELTFSLAEWCCRRGHMYLAVRYLREAIISSFKGILGEFLSSQELKEIEEEMKRDEEKLEAEGILEELKKKISSLRNGEKRSLFWDFYLLSPGKSPSSDLLRFHLFSYSSPSHDQDPVRDSGSLRDIMGDPYYSLPPSYEFSYALLDLYRVFLVYICRRLV